MFFIFLYILKLFFIIIFKGLKVAVLALNTAKKLK
nr:MAG TPA: hypothetical protein [Caudoviricetes sp.]